MSINVLSVLLGGFGLIGPVVGALIHELSALPVLANSARLVSYRSKFQASYFREGLLSENGEHSHIHLHEAVTHTHSHGHNDMHHLHAHSGIYSEPHAHVHKHLAMSHAHIHRHVSDIHHRHEHEVYEED
jgi:hypothetical protein